MPQLAIFLDSADLDEIRRWRPFIDGVTTNPSNLAKALKSAGQTNWQQHVVAIAEAVNGAVSVEVTANTHQEMIAEGEQIAQLHPHFLVKLPTNHDGCLACQALSQKGIACNLTLCFTTAQAVLAARSGAAYISPFIGRLEDAGRDGIGLLGDIIAAYRHYRLNTKVLAASIRSVEHLGQVVALGCDALTAPPSVLEAIWQEPLLIKGLESFLSDWQRRADD